MNTPNLITLADAIERICHARHGSKWATAAANELQATEEARAGSNTLKNVREAQECVKILRRPIELEILDKLGTTQLSAYWRQSNGGLVPISSDYWDVFEVEANRYWPNAKIYGKSEIVYLNLTAVAAFIDAPLENAPVTRYGRRAGETWNIADEIFFEKMASDIHRGMTVSKAAEKYRNGAPGGGTPESRARRLRDHYPRWANRHS